MSCVVKGTIVSLFKQGSISLLSFCLIAGVSSSSMSAYARGQAQKPVRVRAKLDGFDIEPKSGKAPNQIGGASRGIGGLTLYAPKLGKAYTLTPTFYWSADDATVEYTFRLSVLSAGQGQLFETKVLGGMFAYPADAPALMPGATYVWQVTPTNDMFGGPASANILIVGGPEREAVATALHGKPGMSATDAKVYVDKRLWYDAVATYSSLISSEPNHPEYYKGRAELYDQFPQTQALADADMTKAQK
jgi:hypothetical protein